MFGRQLFVFLSFSFGHCIVCPAIYGFWCSNFSYAHSGYIDASINPVTASQ